MGVKWRLRMAGFATALGVVGVPAVAQAPELAMLDGLARGNWDIRMRADGAHRDLCLRTGRELIQIAHGESGCSRYVVDDGSSQVTVHYTCRGNGYGRTTIRKENNGLVQIRSQGIEGGMPFSLEAEARRTGPCR